MQLVTMSYEGINYDLGNIMPVWINGQQQFIIIPTFDYRPPFVMLRVELCHSRMQTLAIKFLKAGGFIPRLKRNPPVTLSPLHQIKVLKAIVKHS